MDKYEIMSQVLNDFDCKKVHKVMKQVDWVWAIPPDFERAEVPSELDIYKCANKLLNDAMKDYGNGKPRSVETGGLRASVDKDGCVYLEFILEYSEYWAPIKKDENEIQES